MISKMAVRHAISGVLKQHNIDDLALECELATSVYGFFERLANGENENIVQGDMLDQFTRQHAELKYREELIQRISKALKLNISDSPQWNEMIKFIERMEREHGQTIEKYQAWREEDVYNCPKAHQIANKPIMI